MMRKTLFRTSCMLVGALVLLWTGCGYESEAPSEPTPSADSEMETETTAESDAMLAAVLARADLADGKEDKVVSKCLGCGLAMDGSADHLLEVEGYTLHLCSDTCQDKVSEDVPAAVQALNLSEE
jgi:hypothetical protein